MAALKRGDDPDENLTEVWRILGPNVGVGAVFRLRDDLVIPASNSGKSHPYAIIGGVPPTQDAPRVALGRFVQLSARTSFKPDLHGPLPTTEDEQSAFAGQGAVFSPAGEPESLGLPGVFRLAQFSTQVQMLAKGDFLGWLPRGVIERLTFRTNRPMPSSPYPPMGGC